MKNGNLDSFGGNADGCLIPINFKDLDFTPKRIFTIMNVPKNSIRGEHAHYKTKQFLFCIRGKILVNLDDGKNNINKIIEKGEYIYIDNFIWGFQQYLTGDDILIVLASTDYDETDYIYNKEEFYKIIKT